MILLFAPTNDPANPFVLVGQVTNISDAVSIALSSDGSCLFIATPGGPGTAGSVRVFDTVAEPFELIGSPIAVGQLPLGFAVAPNGARVYVFNSDNLQANVSVLLGSSVTGGTT